MNKSTAKALRAAGIAALVVAVLAVMQPAALVIGAVALVAEEVAGRRWGRNLTRADGRVS